MFKYSTYQKLLLRTGLMMIAIIYSEFSFSQNCGHALNCRPVQTNTRSVVSPIIRLGAPAAPEEPAAVPVSNQGGTTNTSSGPRRIVIGTSNGANDPGENSIILEDASGKKERVPFGLVQVDFSAIKAMENPESLVANGMLSKVPVKKTASQLNGKVDISISPECQDSLKALIDKNVKKLECGNFKLDAIAKCVNNEAYSPAAHKEFIKTVITTFNDICVER